MFGTNVVFGLAYCMDLLPVESNPIDGLLSSWKISIKYRPISGIRYLIHDHESSFAGMWARIMREE